MSADSLQDSRVGRLIEQALMEDIGFGDITSESLVPEEKLGRGVIQLKEPGIISGIELVPLVFQYADPQTTVTPKIRDGMMGTPGQIIGEVDGPVRGILLAERVALNFLQRMSGIATTTHRFVHAVEGTGAKITDTRKTAPGLRMLDKKAVRDGGGVNHRFGLDQMVLIKDNHIAAAGSLTKAVAACREYLRERKIKIEVEVEATSIAEVAEAVACEGLSRILLDNFSPEPMAEAVRLINHRVEVEASGGVTLATVRQIAETGVDFISVGALTHSPKALDISLEIVS
ncbi:MAG TPA: carboxylating nicotinate-nucleotide diphosphorylase [Bacteroidota bacterium]|nr:carboxylating nicotinate-nucleotide diphosphorylase [Bacteroidota bacterium]